MQPSYVYRKQTHLLDVNQHVRSRHKLYGDTSAASVRPSALATLLVRSRQWGFITAVFVQSIAAAACEDGVTHIDVTRLARLGSHGFHPQNVSTELDKIIPKCRLHDAVLRFKLNLRPSWLAQTFRECTQSIVLPHLFFSSLYNNNKHAFMTSFIGGSVSRITGFWDAVKCGPIYLNSSIKSRPSHITHCIPLTLHGDGIPVAGVGKIWSRSAEVYSFRSLLGRGHTLLKLFYLFLL